MIFIIAICLMAFSSISVADHDAMIAVFKVSQNGNDLKMDLSFDIEDFHNSLSIASEEVTKSQLTQHLKDVTYWEFNDSEIASLTVTNLATKGEHYHATCTLSPVDAQINKLKIKNEFLQDIEWHSNIIMLDLNDTFRDFRMHSKRTSIEVLYK